MLRSICLLLSLGLVLSGCAGLLESDAPPRTTWWLEPVSTASLGGDDAAAWVLDFSVVPGLDTDRILNLSPSARLNHYAGAHWPDHLPEFLGSLVERSLNGASPRRVRLGDYARPGECLVTLEVRRFQALLLDNGSTERVSFEAAGQARCGEVEKAVRIDETAAVNADRMSVIVAAFQRTFDDGMNALATQLATP